MDVVPLPRCTEAVLSTVCKRSNSGSTTETKSCIRYLQKWLLELLQIFRYYRYNKKTKGSKVHAVVTAFSLPVTIDLGPGNEHESRKRPSPLMNIMIRGNRRPRNRPRCVYADNNKYYTTLIMIYLADRGMLQLAQSQKELAGRGVGDRVDHITLTMECTLRSGIASRDSLLG